MKNINLLLWLLLFTAQVNSQNVFTKNSERCTNPKFEDGCIDMLPPTDYIYLASWDYKSDESIDVKAPILLKRNILYAFNICEGSGKTGMPLNLLDDNNKIIQTTETQKAKNTSKIIYFRPQVSGKFYISTLFNKDEENCCLIMLGMIKKDSYTEKFINGK